MEAIHDAEVAAMRDILREHPRIGGNPLFDSLRSHMVTSVSQRAIREWLRVNRESVLSELATMRQVEPLDMDLAIRLIVGDATMGADPFFAEYKRLTDDPITRDALRMWYHRHAVTIRRGRLDAAMEEHAKEVLVLKPEEIIADPEAEENNSISEKVIHINTR